jgi:mannitol/fructose-specific phosphotransferase system IIA component (Ntr-type)
MTFLTHHSIWLESGNQFTDKNTILQFLAHKFSSMIECQSKEFMAEEILENLLAREALQTTAQKKGIAIPHCILKNIKGVYAGFLKIDKPIDFDSKAHHKCDLFICIISAQDAGTEYLKFLAKVSRFMRDAHTQTELRNSNNVKTVFKILLPLMS